MRNLCVFLCIPPQDLDAFPALHRLLCRGNYERLIGNHPEAALCGLFDPSLTTRPPVAALTALHDGIDVSEGYWLRADPIHLEARRTDLLMTDPAVLDIRTEEAHAFAQTINRHLAEEGIELVIGAPNRWYIRLASPPDLVTSPLSLVIGKPVDPYLPTGEDAPLWQRRMTEIQMLLHTHALNEEREARGKSTINGLWLWGGGTPPLIDKRVFHFVHSDDALAVGLAQCSHAGFSGTPKTFDDLPATGNHLVVIDGSHDREEQLADLERSWFAPMLEALRVGRLDQLELLLWSNEPGLFRLRRGDLWRFWRRKAPFAANDGTNA